MSQAEHPVLPRRATDERGRLIPLTPEEIRLRNAGAIKALEALDAITDETESEAMWAEIYRSIDETRPHRKLFEGLY